MTVSTSANRADYSGNGATTAFTVPFYFPDATSLKVLSTVVATGVSTTLTLNSDYTVSGAGVSTGGTVNTTVAPASGIQISILLNLAFVQNTHYVPNDPFPAASHEAALDYLTLLDKQTEEQVSRALQVPPGESAATTTIPAALSRANNLLGFDSSGNPIAVAPVAGTATALATTLASSTGSSGVGWITDATGGQQRTLLDRLRDTKSAFDFMSAAQIADVRAGTHLVDVTAALQAAIDWCAPRGIGIYLPAGTYSVLPGTSSVGAATFNTALVLRSGLKFIGNPSSVFRIADNYSTDASPKEFATFATTGSPVTGVTFDCVTFDQNGANNKMSPARPVTYNSFNHFAVVGNGDTGGISNLLFRDCTFQNCAGECYVSQSFVQNNHVTTLPSGMWFLGVTRFNNSGLDVKDHSSIYSWGTDCLFDNVIGTNPAPPWTTGLTGPKTLIEIHGSRQTIRNCEVVANAYANGVYVAPNFTAATNDILVRDSKFATTDYGILIWRAVGALAYQALDGVTITNNQFVLDDYQHASPPTYKACIAYQGEIGTVQGGVKNIRILDNQYRSTSTTLTTVFVKWNMTGQSGEDTVGLTIKGNEGTGVCNGIDILLNASSNLCALSTYGNKFRECTPDLAGNQPKGILVAGAGLIKTWYCGPNEFIDERATPLMNYGIYLNGGTITDFGLYNQVCKGMLSANVRNAASTITNMVGNAWDSGATNVADGGTISTTANFVGFTPRVALADGIVAGESVQVTAKALNSITVAIKKWPGGTLTAGTTQLVSWWMQL